MAMVCTIVQITIIVSIRHHLQVQTKRQSRPPSDSVAIISIKNFSVNKTHYLSQFKNLFVSQNAGVMSAGRENNYQFCVCEIDNCQKKKTTFKKVLKSHSKNFDNVFVKSKKLKIKHKGEQKFLQIRQSRT